MSLQQLLKEAQDCVGAAAAWLENDEAKISDDEQFVRTWHLTLLTLAQEVSEAVLACVATSTRASRMLNRSLLEYASRAHSYHRAPDRAAFDGLQAQNMARKLMHPARDVKGDMTDSQFKAFQRYMDSGSLEVQFPRVHEMMKDMLRNFGLTNSDMRKFMRWLDSEYTIASGLVHGSQAAILDCFVEGEMGIERLQRSSHFDGNAEIRRAALALMCLVSAMEMHYNETFGVGKLAEKFHRIGRHKGTTSIWKHDALESLLGHMA